MAIRISLSFSEQNVDDIKVYNYLQQKRNKSVFIKDILQKHIENEENEKLKDE